MSDDDRSQDTPCQGTDSGAEDAAEGSRRAFLNQALASSAALAGLALLAEALGASEADAQQPGQPTIRTLRNAPVKFRALDQGISLEVSSRQLAQHLANEGVIEQKYSRGTATVRYDLILI